MNISAAIAQLRIEHVQESRTAQSTKIRAVDIIAGRNQIVEPAEAYLKKIQESSKPIVENPPEDPSKIGASTKDWHSSSG